MTNFSSEVLLCELLAGPYSHFKKVGADDWRDPSEKNAGFSRLKGFHQENVHPVDCSPIRCPSCDEESCGRLCSECGAVIWTNGHLQHLEQYQIE